MAIYHFSAQIIGRSDGRTSTAAAAYRSGTVIECERTGDTHDYTRKQGVADSFIMAPDNAPEWVHDRQALWNAVEAIENRSNSQLARDIEMSLPHELSEDARKAILVSFVQEQFVSRGMVADVNIHAPHGHSDERNHHAHVMLTTRHLTEDGFDQKNRDWNKKDMLITWREKWAEHVNLALENANEFTRIDHRSYADQGKIEQPTMHEGPAITEMRRRGDESEVADQNDAIKRDNYIARRKAQREEIDRLLVDENGQKVDYLEPELLRKNLHDNQIDRRATMDTRHYEQREALEQTIEDQYGEQLRELGVKQETLKGKLDQDGMKGLLRTVSGLNLYDRHKLSGVDKTLADINRRIDEMRSGLDVSQKLDTHHFENDRDETWSRLERFIDRGQVHDYYREESQEHDRENEFNLDNTAEKDLGREMEMHLRPKPPTIH